MGNNGLGYFGYKRQTDRLAQNWDPDEDTRDNLMGPGPKNTADTQGPPSWAMAQEARKTVEDIRRRGREPLEEGVTPGKRSGYVPLDSPGRQPGEKGKGPAASPDARGQKTEPRGSPVRAIDPDRGEGFDQFVEGRAPNVMETFVKETPRGGEVEVTIQKSASPLGQYEVVVDRPDRAGTEWVGSYDDWQVAVDEVKYWMRNEGRRVGRY